MGVGLRYFVVDEDDRVTRVPIALLHRWFGGEPLPAGHAGRELKLLEVVVETERRRVADVLRILPVRHGVREDGRLDVSAALRVATKGFDLFDRLEDGDVAAQIEQLEADANRLWWPTDVQLDVLGTLLFGRPPGAGELIALRASVFRRGVAFEP